jgi:hypothetical protein
MIDINLIEELIAQRQQRRSRRETELEYTIQKFCDREKGNWSRMVARAFPGKSWGCRVWVNYNYAQPKASTLMCNAELNMGVGVQVKLQCKWAERAEQLARVKRMVDA